MLQLLPATGIDLLTQISSEDRAIRGDNVNYRLFRELKRFWKGLNEHEIQAAKNRAVLEHYESMSNPQVLADSLGSDALYSQSNVGSNVVNLLQAVSKQSIHEVVHKYMYDQEFVEVWYGCSDCAVDASAQRGRSWNYLPGGQGFEQIS